MSGDVDELLLEEDLPSEEELLQFLQEAGKVAGWDDPKMEIYDEMTR
jgi:hypothetical protein